MPRKFTDAQEADIASKYLQGGVGAYELAAAHGCNHVTIYCVLERQGVKRRAPHETRRLTEAKERDVAAAFLRGETIRNLADRCGVGLKSIRNALTRAGITERSAHKRLSPQDIALAVTMAKANQSQHFIAATLGVSQSVIGRVLRQQKVETKFKLKGPQHGAWKGGRQVAGGYVRVYVPSEHAMAVMAARDGYVLEHRLVMAVHLGRPLTSRETVHHIDGDSMNNRIENLQLRSGRHGKGSCFHCLDCGSTNVAATAIKD